VDRKDTLAEILGGLDDLAGLMPVIFPIHPRTRQRIAEFGLESLAGRIRLIDPLGYLEAVSLVDQATLVLTDSGGLQEETTVLGVPCLTARANTERPVTITEGTNRLITSTRKGIGAAVGEVLERRAKGDFRPNRPEGWDGRAGERIAALLAEKVP
jgi:UDP-N-acetylglucosamine 2-epimerase (non-hydrolysing)